MLTLIFQSTTAILSLVFGAVALSTALRTPSAPGVRWIAWLLTGVAFSVGGLLLVLQQLLAVQAFIAGPGSSTWDGYLRWAPAGNYSRAFLKIGFAGVLLALPFATTLHPRFWLGVLTGAMAAGGVLGGVSGWHEGKLVELVHYLGLAASSVTLLVVLAFALLTHLIKDSIDRLLWGCLAVYGFRISLGVLWTAGHVWIGVPDAWYPSVWLIACIEAVSYLVMLGFALRYRVLARRDVYVPALFEHLRPLKLRSLG